MWYGMKEVDVIRAERQKEMIFDPSGFFVIFLKDEEIIVEHYTNVKKGGELEVETGRLTTVIKGTDAKAICDTIVEKGLVSRRDHSAYLGRELQKAEIALKKGIEYVQCEPLVFEDG